MQIHTCMYVCLYVFIVYNYLIFDFFVLYVSNKNIFFLFINFRWFLRFQLKINFVWRVCSPHKDFMWTDVIVSYTLVWQSCRLFSWWLRLIRTLDRWPRQQNLQINRKKKCESSDTYTLLLLSLPFYNRRWFKVSETHECVYGHVCLKEYMR